MPKIPYEIDGFVALPHQPKVPDEDVSRSLFIVNLPISTTQAHLTHLFATQLSAGRVERVDFSNHVPPKSIQDLVPTNRKRKRISSTELRAELERQTLPTTLPGSLLNSGSSATVVFIDRASKDLSLRNARKAAKHSTEIIWGRGMSKDKLSSTGIERYAAHKTMQYPTRADLLRKVDEYMTTYAEMEQVRSQENAKKRAEPDEDGFITVTRGSKGAVRQEEAKDLGVQMKEKTEARSLDNFYRFQMREKRRAQQNEMLQRFESDKKQVEEMRRRRGNLKPDS